MTIAALFQTFGALDAHLVEIQRLDSFKIDGEHIRVVRHLGDDGAGEAVGKDEVCAQTILELRLRQDKLRLSSGQHVGRHFGDGADQLLRGRVIVGVDGVQAGRPVRGDGQIDHEAAFDAVRRAIDFFQQFDPRLCAPASVIELLIGVVGAVSEEGDLHAAEARFREGVDLLGDGVVFIDAGAGIREPHARHRFGDGIRRKEVLQYAALRQRAQAGEKHDKSQQEREFFLHPNHLSFQKNFCTCSDPNSHVCQEPPSPEGLKRIALRHKISRMSGSSQKPCGP